MLEEFSQDTKIVHVNYEDYDVYIGRGSEFGNPFTHIKDRETKAQFIVRTREDAIRSYRQWIYDRPDLLEKIETLRGKKLGCYCKRPGAEKSCHGDVIIEILNSRQF